MACGTGKTIVMIEYIKYLFGKNKKTKVLLLFPSLQLISQTYNRIASEFKNIMCICSDMDAKALTADEVSSEFEKDIYNEFLANDYNKIYTTDIDIIKKNIAKKDIILCSYQSSKLLDKQKFDVCIYDEAHKTVNNTTFNFTIDDNNCNIGKRIFFTATPRYYKGANDSCVSMCDKEKYGEEVYNYNFKAARDNQYLLDFQVLSYVVNDVLLGDLMKEKYIKNDKLENVNSNDIIAAIQLAQHIKTEISCKKILTYHSTVNRAEQFKRTLNYIFEKYDISANVYVMSGKTRMCIRREIINEFEGKDIISIICSSKVLNEGVDIPIVDTIVFVDSRKSTIDVTQCVGRRLRLHKDKNICTIIIPVMYNKIEENHNFTNLINILTAMSEIDANIIEYFTTKNKSNKLTIRSMSDIIMKDFSNVDNVKYKFDDILENLKCQVLKSIQLSWEINKRILFDYCEKYNKTSTKRLSYKDHNIGTWLQTQKVNIIDSSCYLYKILSQNEYVKDSLDKYIKNKIYKNETNKKAKVLTFDEWRDLLFNYCNTNKKTPTRDIMCGGTYNIGIWLYIQKRDIINENCESYKKLACNEYVKESIDNCLNFRNSKDKEKKLLKIEEWKLLLFEYIDINKKIPSISTSYKKYNIGQWLSDQKKKIKSGDNTVYQQLSQNKYLDENLKEYMIYIKNKDPNKQSLTFEEWKNLLFEYCNCNNKVLSFNTIYKDYNIGQWLSDQKKKIKAGNISICEQLSQNKYLHENLKKYIEYASNNTQDNLTFDEGKTLLFEYCNNNKKVPQVKENYKHCNIGAWLSNKKIKISDNTCDMYKELSTNKYVRECLDNYIKIKLEKIQVKKCKEVRELIF